MTSGQIVRHGSRKSNWNAQRGVVNSVQGNLYKRCSVNCTALGIMCSECPGLDFKASSHEFTRNKKHGLCSYLHSSAVCAKMISVKEDVNYKMKTNKQSATTTKQHSQEQKQTSNNKITTTTVDEPNLVLN